MTRAGSRESFGAVDADGVALAAIQGLYKMIKEKDAEIAALKAEKGAEIAELKARLAAIEAAIGSPRGF